MPDLRSGPGTAWDVDAADAAWYAGPAGNADAAGDVDAAGNDAAAGSAGNAAAAWDDAATGPTGNAAAAWDDAATGPTGNATAVGDADPAGNADAVGNAAAAGDASAADSHIGTSYNPGDHHRGNRIPGQPGRDRKGEDREGEGSVSCEDKAEAPLAEAGDLPADPCGSGSRYIFRDPLSHRSEEFRLSGLL